MFFTRLVATKDFAIGGLMRRRSFERIVSTRVGFGLGVRVDFWSFGQKQVFERGAVLHQIADCACVDGRVEHLVEVGKPEWCVVFLTMPDRFAWAETSSYQHRFGNLLSSDVVLMRALLFLFTMPLFKYTQIRPLLRATSSWSCRALERVMIFLVLANLRQPSIARIANIALRSINDC